MPISFLQTSLSLIQRKIFLLSVYSIYKLKKNYINYIYTQIYVLFYKQERLNILILISKLAFVSFFKNIVAMWLFLAVQSTVHKQNPLFLSL